MNAELQDRKGREEVFREENFALSKKNLVLEEQAKELRGVVLELEEKLRDKEREREEAANQLLEKQRELESERVAKALELRDRDV